MNKVKGNMYNFINYTWNAIKGPCSHGCDYCLDGDTLILMSDLSYKKLREVQIGEKVIGIEKGKDYRFMKESTVQNKIQLRDIAYSIKTEDTEILCSSNHKWLIDRGRWRSIINNLKIGSKIKILNSSVVEQSKTGDSYKKGYLRGMILGDANLKTYHTKQQKIVRNCKEYIYSPKIAYKFRLALKDTDALYRSKDYLDYFGVKTFNHIHAGLDSIRKDGKGSFIMIKNIIGSKRDSPFLAGFLGGIFDAEGSFSEGALRIHNQKIEEIIAALDYFGFKYHIGLKKEKDYTITLNGGFDEQVRFFNITNPAILRKRRRFLKAIKKGYSKIKSIDRVGERSLYDIQTSTENFIANGLISHNCYMIPFWRGEIHLDEKELKTNLGKDNFIFIGSSTDMFADNVRSDWILKVLAKCNKHPENTYLFQSKNPDKFMFYTYAMPKRVVLGTTIETNRAGFNYNAPTIKDRVRAMSSDTLRKFRKMVTIEPIRDFDVMELADMINEICPEWVNIGADSKGHKLEEPSYEKIELLVKELEKFTKVKIKDNLRRLK